MKPEDIVKALRVKSADDLHNDGDALKQDARWLAADLIEAQARVIKEALFEGYDNDNGDFVISACHKQALHDLGEGEKG